MSDMPTPMTTELREALHGALQLESMFGDLGLFGVNDRDHYASALTTLDRLVTALLSASAASPTARREYTGARFDLGGKSGITPLLTEAAQYLMRGGVPTHKLSLYGDAHTKQVRGELTALVGVTLDSVARYAREDMHAIREASAGRFLAVADQVAGAVDDRDATRVAGDED